MNSGSGNRFVPNARADNSVTMSDDEVDAPWSLPLQTEVQSPGKPPRLVPDDSPPSRYSSKHFPTQRFLEPTAIPVADNTDEMVDSW